ncbi:MAG: rhomboid family intramembrane serine protease [Chlamydiae bacterium]|nr:rhomboid family intramembrane serine protease [Chlamydiota bacterium]
MRLIGELDSEKEVVSFSLFLTTQKINHKYEFFEDPSQAKKGFRLWVYDEDDWSRAIAFYAEYKQHPDDLRFRASEIPVEEADSLQFKIEGSVKMIKLSIHKIIRPFPYLITYGFLCLCVGLFLVNLGEKKTIAKEKGLLAEEILLTPSQTFLLFDYTLGMQAVAKAVEQFPVTDDLDLAHLPAANQAALHQAEDIPSWKGFLSMGKEKAPQGSPVLFEKIRTGQVWRLFTPCLLHSDFLHILFNMSWLWILGRQIEDRLSKGKLLLFIGCVGVLASLAQYFMSGPYFLGFSGVVVGMAGFIWSRQKKAPWEGYPLQKSTLYFILVYIILMVGLEIGLVLLNYLSSHELGINIANTAHVVGGLVGLGLGRLNYFARGDF